MAKVNRVIGLLGGTFDPVHNGHVLSAIELKKRLNLDEMRLLPCQKPPHRGMPMCDSCQRLAMIKLALAPYPELSIDERELHQTGPSYTVDTLESLRKELGEHTSLCWVMGSDAFAQLDSWHHWQRLLTLAHIIVLTRPKLSFTPSHAVTSLAKSHAISTADLHKKTAGGIVYETLTQYPISATSIRKAFTEGRPVADGLLAPCVLHYIETNRLYLGVH